MLSESAKTGDLALSHSSQGHVAKQKPKGVPELGLVLAFVVLLAWALYVFFDGVSWLAITHTIKALLAAIW
jgi:hypothetical protein